MLHKMQHDPHAVHRGCLTAGTQARQTNTPPPAVSSAFLLTSSASFSVCCFKSLPPSPPSALHAARRRGAAVHGRSCTGATACRTDCDWKPIRAAGTNEGWRLGQAPNGRGCMHVIIIALSNSETSAPALTVFYSYSRNENTAVCHVRRVVCSNCTCCVRADVAVKEISCCSDRIAFAPGSTATPASS